MRKKLLVYVMCAAAAFVNIGCGGSSKVDGKAHGDVVKGVNAQTLCENDGRYVEVDTLENLIVYYPNFSTIDLVCGEMPVKEDTCVIFCAAAAFTGSFIENFKHSNVAGDHVSSGKRYEGYECRVNTGCFVYYGGHEWDFIYGEHSRDLDKAAQRGGMGYAQIMMINEGKVKQNYRTNPRNTKDVNEFRALCELNGRLCVIDSRGFVNFRDFVKDLLQTGVSDAIYMDMGEGWNYSWWRHSDGTAIEIHETPSAYTTNWITFYK
ncbi:MAG: hypothetical protein IJ328_04585 [Muribaculaceae bacterium]|nr:hypothetical protein [Muribaculaceae bacterium]